MDVHNATLKARNHHLCLAIVVLVSWSLAVQSSGHMCLGIADKDAGDKDAGIPEELDSATNHNTQPPKCGRISSAKEASLAQKAFGPQAALVVP